MERECADEVEELVHAAFEKSGDSSALTRSLPILTSKNCAFGYQGACDAWRKMVNVTCGGLPMVRSVNCAVN